MKRLHIVIGLYLLLLVALVTGCGRAPRYDSRLAAADSLLRDHTDSALTVIQSLSPDSLATLGDRAYHDLLLTQARYRCYITATSDSDINRALAYYRQHSHEREKLTRAYIYKGAVMEELGHPDSAMLYYKQAEATADPDDYFNLGYVKLRIGYLYGNVYALNGKDIEKYEESVDCFFQTNDTDYQIISLNNLGCVYRETMPDKAITLFQQAADLANKLDDTTSIVSIYHSMVVLLYHQGKYDEAHRLIQEISQYHLEPDCFNSGYYFCAANVYTKNGMSDSAKVFFDLATRFKESNPDEYRINYLRSLGEMALANSDTISYLKYRETSQKIADSLKANEKRTVLLKIENDYDKEVAMKEKDYHLKTKDILVFLLIVVFIAAIVGPLVRKYHYDGVISVMKKENDQQLQDLLDLRRKIDALQIRDEQLKDFIISHTGMMREVIEACYHEPRNKLANEIKRIINYQKENREKWVKLYDYIDVEYNGIMKHTLQNYPQLNEKDILLLALSCLGYSCAQIAIITGYSNATSISGNRQRLAKKMGLNCSLDDYIAQFQGK